MYTGIVETTGRVVAVEDGGDGHPVRRVTVRCPEAAATKEPGDSVAISGTCVTVETNVLAKYVRRGEVSA